MMSNPVMLIVDDDAAIRRALVRLVGRDRRVTTIEAPDALSALRTLEQEPVDVVVSDEVMPQMSGLRLLETVRTHWPATRRILFTGHPDAELVMQAVNRGGVHKVLAKGTHPEELRAEITDVLASIDARATPAEPAAEAKRSILVVADELAVCTTHRAALRAHGFDARVTSTRDAFARLARGEQEVVLLDITSPATDATAFLRQLRDFDLDCPVIVTTPRSELERAHEALKYGAYRYLIHPVPRHTLAATVSQAATLRRIAKLRRSASTGDGQGSWELPDRAALETRFRRALEALYMVYQPIVSWSEQRVMGYEALVRSREPSLTSPGALFDAASRLDRAADLRRAIRALAPAPFAAANAGWLFLNVHIDDLNGDDLLEEDLASMAHRIVLEVSERTNLESVEGAAARIASLRQRGFRIAVDDLGAGYAGLTSFAILEPELAKLDMSLIRGIDRAPVKQRLVAGLQEACADLGVALVAEGVETPAERDALIAAGCDLFQGFLFGRPSTTLEAPSFSE